MEEPEAVCSDNTLNLGDICMTELQSVAYSADCMKNGVHSKSSVPQITDLPPEIMQLILKKLSFENISKLRLVSRYFNSMCSSLLNSEFTHLRSSMLQRFNSVKALMPRRESARRKHPLSRKSDILESLYMRLSLLHMTFGKHIENKSCCFFPGEVIDEIYRILQYIDSTPNLNRAYKVTDELFDLSTMALEYFRENIEPSLPEVSYLSYDVLHYSPLMTTSVDLVIQKTKSKLVQMEITDSFIPNETTPQNNISLDNFMKELKLTRQMVKRNKDDIAKFKKSLKITKMKVKTAMRKLRKVRWQQSNCKKLLLNDVLHTMERKKHESSTSDVSVHLSCSSDIKMS